METFWISEFLILYFQCFAILSKQVAGLVTTIPYPAENTVNLSCWNTSQIQIQNIDIQEEETSCRTKPCVLNSQDTQTIEDNCNGEHSCLVDYNFTSSCLREFQYVNLSYTCKHENGTSLSTFEEDYGDWKFDSLNNTAWKRDNSVIDHTRKNLAQRGYSIHAYSFIGKAGTTRIDTDKEFTESICLSLWYQFYTNAIYCVFSIYKITDGKKLLLFTIDGNSTLFNTWIKTSVNIYGRDPFRIALEAYFKQRNTTAVRLILIDDTSIAYRPCEGQQLYSSCHDLKEPIEIECETQYLLSEIDLFFEPKHLTSHLKKCSTESIKHEINRFCRNLNKTDKCKFSVLKFTSGYEDCYISSKNISVSYQCSDNSQTTTLERILTESSTMFKDNFQTTPHLKISAESSTTVVAGIPVIIVSTLVILIVAAIVVIVIVCNRRKRAKQCQTQLNTTAAEMIDSSDYNVINYEEMKDISIRKMNENTDQTHTTQHQPQNIKTTIEQDKNICNKYESCSTNRNSVEHVYESDSIHTNQYESLTNRQELDTHAYESTEHVLPQNKKTSIGQDENICNRYESLSTNRNSAEHIYESDTIPINHYQSLKQQKGLDEHTYESTEHALPVSMNQDLSQYEPLTIPPESDEHTYESTEHASQVSMKQEASQYESLTNPPESDKRVYASTKSPR